MPIVVLALPFVLIWTSAFPAAKLGLMDSPPLLFLSVRFLIAGALLMAWSALRGDLRWPKGREWLILLVLGWCNHSLYLGLSWTGMGSLSSGLATILISANPIVVAALSALWLKEPLSRTKWLGLCLGFAGVAFIVRSRVGGPADSLHGFVLVLLALFTLASGTVFYKKYPVSMGVVAATGFQIVLSGLTLLPLAIWMEPWSAVQVTPRFLVSLAWMVLVVSIAGYLLWFNMLEKGSASAASVWLFLTPPLGLVAGYLLLDEPLHPLDFIGIVPVVLGIALVTRVEPSPGV
ncbi:DMT family transporter [Limnobacter humi]|uniref:DMT family transporter n=1 Tax=Limnobacter humi TaxID=1778671 RepID=A0ABT1WDG3_9BURK|nr:DMT family transporter [Limnobacter humi]MCQ8895562.1 DMT family transporter [Limnobacter humi]